MKIISKLYKTDKKLAISVAKVMGVKITAGGRGASEGYGLIWTETGRGR